MHSVFLLECPCKSCILIGWLDSTAFFSLKPQFASQVFGTHVFVCAFVNGLRNEMVRPPLQLLGSGGDQSLMDLRQFPNSFRVAGLKHVSDNALKGLLEGTRTWKVLIPRLRAVEVLLKGIMNRQRLSHSCVTSEFPCEQKRLEFFSASLKGLRWHAVSAFCIELLKLERILRCLDQ